MTLTQNKKTWIFILIAFIFSVSIRMIWVVQFSDMETFKYNEQFMINTNDGYVWAEGARDILSGVHQDNDHSPIDSATSQLTAIIAKLLPFSFESIILFMPVFFSSLIVIPIILMAKSIGKLEAGFIAALLGSIAWSYYNRTMVGYYDTDFLVIVFPTFLLWSLVLAIQTNQNRYLVFSALEIIAYRWWYPPSYSLEFAFFSLILIYTIYKYIKKEGFTYSLILLSFMMFAMIQLDGIIRVVITIGLFSFLHFKRELVYRYSLYIFVLAVLLFLYTGGLDPIVSKLKSYVFKDTVSVVGDSLKLQFFTVHQTVREAGQIPFETFANRISGHTITFIFSMVGYIWLVFNHRIMLLSLPMLGLGFLALSGGLRFTIYAVPILALGIGYLIFELSNLMKYNVYKKYLAMSILTLFILIPNIQHAIDYKVPTVFNKNEVIILDKLKQLSHREDYVVSWWDYAYPIRYYSDVKTIIDGGTYKQVSDIYNTSFMLTNPPNLSSKMMRLTVEYMENKFKIDKEDIDLPQEEKRKLKTHIAQMTLDYGHTNTNDFIFSLHGDIKLPKKTRDVYLYLPHRMMSILPTVAIFSNRDLHSGEVKGQFLFHKADRFSNKDGVLSLGGGISCDTKNGSISFGKQKTTIKQIITTELLKDGSTKVVNTQVYNKNAQISLIYMKSYGSIIVANEKVLNSTYIKLFVLQDYDKDLFELVITDPFAKVYKLKI